MTELHHDIMGLACADYLAGQKGAKIKVHSNIAEDDYIPVAYLFRQFNDMPLIEQEALKRCNGKTLDVGAGAGSHAMWLQSKSVETTALDFSPGLCSVMTQRGVLDVVQADFFDYQQPNTFDTVLMLMNGVGISGTLDGLGRLLATTKELLKPNGQLLVDSCDIAYLFDDPETEHLPETFSHYYGEIRYQMSYKKQRGPRFGWLFIDPKMLAAVASQSGWRTEIVMEGENGGYLAKLML